MSSMHLGNDLTHDKKTGKLILYLIEKNWFAIYYVCVCVFGRREITLGFYVHSALK